MKIIKSKKIVVILITLLVISLIPVSCMTINKNDYSISIGVLYSNGQSYKDIVYYLEQSNLLGLDIMEVDINKTSDFKQYDIIYLDNSLADTITDDIVNKIISYTNQGGFVFLNNNFLKVFPLDYIGASSTKEIHSIDRELIIPKNLGNASVISETVFDYSTLYKKYKTYKTLKTKNYGQGIIPSTAKTLVSLDETTIYSLNNYGKGAVLLTNYLLPNDYSAGSLTMSKDTDQTAFASTTQSFNSLMYSSFAQYYAKQKYGYALERVYGYYGTPSMSWELHYEEITGIKNGSMQTFDELCRKYNQIPSFTLIRNSYQWFLKAESISYLTNSEKEKFSYKMDFNENGYSSGTHVVSSGKWLSIEEYSAAGSYFIDDPNHTARTYPCIIDYNNDGLTDIISGSMNGQIYYYEGQGYKNGHLVVGDPILLKYKTDNIIDYGNYSAPTLTDINKDGNLDLICGWDDGIVRLFYGNGTNSFSEPINIINTYKRTQCLPDIADFNNDGTYDIILGSNTGSLNIYLGTYSQGKASFTKSQNLSYVCNDTDLGLWLAPTTLKWNDDDLLDIAIGTYDGYIAILTAESDGSYSFDSFLSTTEMNYKGNKNIKFGNWAVPRFYDLDGNKLDDIVCGHLEYGMAYPIDSEYFPYKEELEEQVKYAKDNNFYMGIHFYTNGFASEEREIFELEAHKKAFEYYGLETSKIGANQHTWHTSSLSPSQTMNSLYKSDVLWQSGFGSSGDSSPVPQIAAENVVSLPFFLINNNGEKTTLIQNNSTTLYGGEDWNQLSAKYNMPICLYYHCDFAYKDRTGSEKNIIAASEFQKNHNYNFNKENQLIKASAAALSQKVSVSGSIKNSQEINLSLDNPAFKTELFDKKVYNSLGVRVLLSDEYEASDFSIDADVWYLDGNEIVLGLNRSVKITKSTDGNPTHHITKINSSSKIKTNSDGATVTFLEGGMMQLTVCGQAKSLSEGWDYDFAEGYTTFTKYGDASKLSIKYITN